MYRDSFDDQVYDLNYYRKMGKQINFILLPIDLKTLEKEIGKVGSFVVLHSRSNSSEVRRLNELDNELSSENWLYFFLVRPDDINLIITQYIESGNYWAIDGMRSPVIEFHKCFFDGKNIRRGRAYFVDKYYDSNNDLVQKADAFRSWASLVLKTIRKQLRRRDYDYIGLEASNWLTSGDSQVID